MKTELINKLKEFSKVANELSELWLSEKEPNDAIKCINYPFELSFDEVVAEIDVWVDDNIIKDAEPKLFARKCDCCGKGMDAGYCIAGGERYYCGDSCLTMTYDFAEQKDLGIGDDDSDSYWTEWDADDKQYQEINGVLIEIEEE